MHQFLFVKSTVTHNLKSSSQGWSDNDLMIVACYFISSPTNYVAKYLRPHFSCTKNRVCHWSLYTFGDFLVGYT